MRAGEPMTGWSARAALAAVVFDLDGVLVDSEPIWRAAEIEVFARHGLVLGEDECRQTMGLRVDEVVAYWIDRDRLTPVPGADVAGDVVDRVIELHGARPRPMPGALEAVAAAGRTGARLAIASSSPLRVIDAAVGALGLREAFEVIQSAEHEAHGKPHPAVYSSAARRLGVDAAGCVAVEDSPNGVMAALAAGMRCIAVPEPGVRGDPRFDRAHLVLGGLGELPAAFESLR